MNDPEFPVTGGHADPAGGRAAAKSRFASTSEDQINTAMENRFELGRAADSHRQRRHRGDRRQEQSPAAVQFRRQRRHDRHRRTLWELPSATTPPCHLEYSAGVQLEIPIGNRAARAIWKRAQLQRLQAITQYRSDVDMVSLDVKTGDPRSRHDLRRNGRHSAVALRRRRCPRRRRRTRKGQRSPHPRVRQPQAGPPAATGRGASDRKARRSPPTRSPCPTSSRPRARCCATTTS